jgi:hypothetical protein
VPETNGFDMAATFDDRPEYWLRATRTCMAGDVIGEAAFVYGVAKQYGGAL